MSVVGDSIRSVDVDEAIKALALEWLQSVGVPATSGGFYSSFNVEITYATEACDYNTMTVEGEKMASLWQFVLNRAAGQASSVPA